MRPDTGRPIGILTLDTAFERFPGDGGHPGTWSFPVLRRVVEGATAARATTLTDDALLAPFVAGARALEAEGAAAIMTSCGFLALYQRQLAAAVRVPVAASALIQVTWLQALLSRPVGVLTFDPASLGPAHLVAVGADPTRAPVGGLDADSAFRRDILGGPAAGFAQRERDAVAAARRLVARHPDLGALVLECTNFAPHSVAIADVAGLPVYDIVTLMNWLAAGFLSAGTVSIRNSASAQRRLTEQAESPDNAALGNSDATCAVASGDGDPRSVRLHGESTLLSRSRR